MNKKILLSIVLFGVGTLGAGLFAIANSLERSHQDSSIMCGILLAVFLVISVVGLIMLIAETINSGTNK